MSSYVNISPKEEKRLAALYRYEILDSSPEEAFDKIAFLAAKLLKMPVALISLVDRDRLWYKSHYGLENSQVDREYTFCEQTILKDNILIITDAKHDPEFSSNPYVKGNFGLQFYAGVPLKTHDNFNIGTFCVVDFKPRKISDDEVEILITFAKVVMDQMELRMSAKQIQSLHRSLEKAHKELQIKSSQDYLTGLLTRDAIFTKLNESFNEIENANIGVLLIDLDHFKNVNDTYGHLAGDNVLAEIAKRLKLGSRPQDFVGRIGGDEFLVIVVASEKEMLDENIAARLLNEVRSTPILIDPENHIELNVTVTIGMCVASQASKLSEKEILNKADQALYDAKRKGRNCFSMCK